MNQQNKSDLVENKDHVQKVVEMVNKENHTMELKQAITKLWWNNPKIELTVDR